MILCGTTIYPAVLKTHKYILLCYFLIVELSFWGFFFLFLNRLHVLTYSLPTMLKLQMKLYWSFKIRNFARYNFLMLLLKSNDSNTFWYFILCLYSWVFSRRIFILLYMKRHQNLLGASYNSSLYQLEILFGWKLQNPIMEAQGFIFFITTSPERSSPWLVQQILNIISVPCSFRFSFLQ